MPPKSTGRPKGATNLVTRELKALIDKMLPDEKLQTYWKRFLDSSDDHIAIKAFEMALHYRYGKPVQTVIGAEEIPPVRINISAIPTYREKAEKTEKAKIN